MQVDEWRVGVYPLCFIQREWEVICYPLTVQYIPCTSESKLVRECVGVCQAF